ncbi:MAG: MlaD family protein [Gammaproteobacteria bacterium]|nr:MlaD family protein [Gammaproteobacteria bacterium]MDH5735279.1 MlaD family protein [Gammaproteobacteria bacterium]
MRQDKINYFLVGLFVLTSLLILLTMLYRVTGAQAGAVSYYVVFDKLSNIKKGTGVTYGGYQIGRVNDIAPFRLHNKTQYKIHLEINGEWQIPGDSVAQIVMPGLIADKIIEITEGSSSDMLKPGDTINSRRSADMMELVNSIASELDRVIPGLSEDLAGLIAKLNNSADQLALMFNDTNRQHINNAFVNADQATDNLKTLSIGFNRVNQQLEEVLQRSNSILAINDDDLRFSVIKLRESMGVISENLQSIMYNIETSTRNMNEFSRQLRDNPGVILSGKPPADEAGAHK